MGRNTSINMTLQFTFCGIFPRTTSNGRSTGNCLLVLFTGISSQPLAATSSSFESSKTIRPSPNDEFVELQIQMTKLLLRKRN